MKKLLKNSRWVYYALGIISGLIIISSLFFMNQYKFVRINYNKIDGKIEYVASAKLNNASQDNLFDFIDNISGGAYDTFEESSKFINSDEYLSVILKKENGSYKYLVENSSSSSWISGSSFRLSNDVLNNLLEFRESLDTFNNLILWYGIVSLICFAVLIILSNHNRKIYYKANLYGGIGIPLVNVIFSIVLIVMLFTLIAKINDPVNNAVYNVVSALQNPKIAAGNVNLAKSDATNLTHLQNIAKGFNVNGATMIAYMVFFGLTAAYNVFLIIFAILKYKDTEKERNDTLEKARLAGEKV